jgi:hypothetical protein
LSLAGFQCAASMPFRMPLSRSARARSTPSRPTPAASVWISSAYVGLTVVIASANCRPAFSIESWPQNSTPSMPRQCRGTPSASALSMPNTPWNARLWMVMTLAATLPAGSLDRACAR